MASLSEKIVLGVIAVVLIGFNSFFIFGQQNDLNVVKDNAEKIVLINIQQKEISQEQAKSIALKVAPGRITEVEERTGNGMVWYAVEIDDGTQEIEVKINKKNGDILKVTREAKDDDEDEEISQEELKTIKGRISEEEAKKIALEAVKGGRVIGVEVERENGRLVYEVEVAAQGDTAEVEIDGETGEVLEIEWGDDDDD